MVKCFDKHYFFLQTILELFEIIFTLLYCCSLLCNLMAPNSPEKYFKYANPFTYMLVIVGMTTCHLGCYNPHAVPDQYMGPIGWLFRYLVYSHPLAIQVIYHSAIIVHVGEAIYSLHVAKSKGITDSATRLKWFLQTLLLGFGSLRLLLPYTPKKSR